MRDANEKYSGSGIEMAFPFAIEVAQGNNSLTSPPELLAGPLRPKTITQSWVTYDRVHDSRVVFNARELQAVANFSALIEDGAIPTGTEQPERYLTILRLYNYLVDPLDQLRRLPQFVNNKHVDEFARVSHETLMRQNTARNLGIFKFYLMLINLIDRILLTIGAQRFNPLSGKKPKRNPRNRRSQTEPIAEDTESSKSFRSKGANAKYAQAPESSSGSSNSTPSAKDAEELPPVDDHDMDAEGEPENAV